MAEVLAFNFVVILALLLIVVPFLARVFDTARPTNRRPGGGAMSRPEKPATIVAAINILAVGPVRAFPIVVPTDETPNGFEPDDIPPAAAVEGIEGNVDDSSIKRIGAIIEMRPREAAGVISAWLREKEA